MQIKIDGIDYIVSDQAGFDRLKEDIKSNNNGMRRAFGKHPRGRQEAY